MRSAPRAAAAAVAFLLVLLFASPPVAGAAEGFRDLVLRHLARAGGVETLEIDDASLSLFSGTVRVRGLRLAAGGAAWRWKAEAAEAEVRFTLPGLLLLGTIDSATARGGRLAVERVAAGESTPWILPWGWLRRAPGVRIRSARIEAETVVVVDRIPAVPEVVTFSMVRILLRDVFDTPPAFHRAGALEASAKAWRLDSADTAVDGGRLDLRARFPSSRRPEAEIRVSDARLLGAPRLVLSAAFDDDGHLRLLAPAAAAAISPAPAVVR